MPQRVNMAENEVCRENLDYVTRLQKIGEGKRGADYYDYAHGLSEETYDSYTADYTVVSKGKGRPEPPFGPSQQAKLVSVGLRGFDPFMLRLEAELPGSRGRLRLSSAQQTLPHGGLQCAWRRHIKRGTQRLPDPSFQTDCVPLFPAHCGHQCCDASPGEAPH
ncbi:KH domain-containing, RNA-binding, signal transduction-associated protein 3 [Varanus komodoensis]|nr:KH domain-containing, RNA-binding, signal transduction-associated protein 3 [Varanus komodoensis]